MCCLVYSYGRLNNDLSFKISSVPVLTVFSFFMCERQTEWRANCVFDWFSFPHRRLSETQGVQTFFFCHHWPVLHHAGFIDIEDGYKHIFVQIMAFEPDWKSHFVSSWILKTFRVHISPQSTRVRIYIYQKLPKRQTLVTVMHPDGEKCVLDRFRESHPLSFSGALVVMDTVLV